MKRQYGIIVLLLNLLIGVPLCCLYLTNNVKVYSISIANSNPVSINFGEIVPSADTPTFYKWSSSHPSDRPFKWGQRLNSERKLTRPAFEFKGATNIVVTGISLRKSWVFEQVIKPKDIIDGFAVSHGAEMSLDSGGVRISSPKAMFVLSANKHFAWPCTRIIFDKMTCLLVCLCELAFLFLAIIGCNSVVQDRDTRKSWTYSFCVAMCASAFFTLCIPLQTYLGNRASYGMPLSDVLEICVPLFLVATMLAALVLKRLSRYCGYFFHSILVAIVVYEYFQTGIMSASAPAMNGTTDYYRTWTLKLVDMGVCAIALGGAILSYKAIAKYVQWISVGAMIMMAASLLDVRPAPAIKDSDSSYASFLSAKENVAKNIQLSRTHNVLWFVLDACTTEIAQDLIGHEQDVADALVGFTSFSNSIGMHPYTNFALPGYVSGQYLRSANIPVGAMEYKDECFGTNTVFETYRRNDVPATFIPSAYYYGYRYPALGNAVAAPTETKCSAVDSFFMRGSEPPAFTLFEMIRFRLTPFLFKCRHIDWLYSGMDFSGSMDDEAILFPYVSNAGLIDSNNALFVCHTRGGHWPYLVDENGASLPRPARGYKHYYNQVHYVFRSLNNVFNRLRERGVFDNSWVIISADHGQDEFVKSDLEENGVPNRASAMVMVKPPHSRGGVVVDGQTPVSLARMHVLVRALCTSDPSLDSVKELLSEQKRHYVWPKDSDWEEWEIDADRTCRKIRGR